MTLNMLQEELVIEIKQILRDIQFVGKDGNKRVLEGYIQARPMREALLQEGWDLETGYQNTDQKDLYPCFVVRATDVKYPQGENPEAEINILFGIYDPGERMEGYYTLISCLERTVERFLKDPIMGEYWCKKEFETAIQEDDTVPYFFGGIHMTWNLPAIEMEEFN